MAILKHISVKNRFYSDAVEYLTCQFDEYTNKPILDGKGRIMERENYLIDGVNCDVDSFGAECIETNRFYGKNNSVNDVKAHHYIISFEPEDDITMEQAMEFGKKWLAEFAPGHQAVVAVHVGKRMASLKKALADGDILDEFDRVVFESIVEKVIVGETNEDGTVDPYKLTFVMKGNGNSVVPNAKEWFKAEKSAIQPA